MSFRLLLMSVLLLSLSNCSKKPNLSGVVQLGRVKSAIVRVYALSPDGQRLEPFLEETVTNENGEFLFEHFPVSLKSPVVIVVLKNSKGETSYIDEISGRKLPFNGELSALVLEKDPKRVAVTPMSHMVETGVIGRLKENKNQNIEYLKSQVVKDVGFLWGLSLPEMEAIPIDSEKLKREEVNLSKISDSSLKATLALFTYSQLQSCAQNSCGAPLSKIKQWETQRKLKSLQGGRAPTPMNLTNQSSEADQEIKQEISAARDIVISNFKFFAGLSKSPPEQKLAQSCLSEPPESRLCKGTNGNGIERRSCNTDGSWGVFGACELVDCDAGHSLMSGLCVPKPASCLLKVLRVTSGNVCLATLTSNGGPALPGSLALIRSVGQVTGPSEKFFSPSMEVKCNTWEDTRFHAVIRGVKSPDQEIVCEPTSITIHKSVECAPNTNETRSCNVENGSGIQTRTCLPVGAWGDYGNCSVSCKTDFELRNGACVSVVQESVNIQSLQLASQTLTDSSQTSKISSSLGNVVVFSGLAAGSYHPDKIYNWNPYAFDDVIIAQASTDGTQIYPNANIYASSLIRRGSKTYLFYGGNDYQFQKSATDTTYLAESDNFLKRSNPADIAPPEFVKHGVTLAGGDEALDVDLRRDPPFLPKNPMPPWAGWGLNDPTSVILNWTKPDDTNFDNTLILFSAAKPHHVDSTQSWIGFAITNLFPQTSWLPQVLAGFCDVYNRTTENRCSLRPDLDNKVRIRDSENREVSTAHRPSLVKDGDKLWLYFDQGGIYSAPSYSNAEWVANNYLIPENSNSPGFASYKNDLEGASCHFGCPDTQNPDQRRTCLIDCYRKKVEQARINERIRRDCENEANIPCKKREVVASDLKDCYLTVGEQPELVRNGLFCEGIPKWHGTVIARSSVSDPKNFTIVRNDALQDGGSIDVKKFAENKWILFEDDWPSENLRCNNSPEEDRTEPENCIRQHIHPKTSTDGINFTKTPWPIWTTRDHMVRTNPTIITDLSGTSLRGLLYGEFTPKEEGQCNPLYRWPHWGNVCISWGRLKAMFLQKRVEFRSDDERCTLINPKALDEDRTQFELSDNCPPGKISGTVRIFDTEKVSTTQSQIPLIEARVTLERGRLFQLPSNQGATHCNAGYTLSNGVCVAQAATCTYTVIKTDGPNGNNCQVTVNSTGGPMASGYPKVFKKADSFNGYNEIPGTYDGGTSVSLAKSQANHSGVCSAMQRTFFKVMGRGIDATSEVVCNSTLPVFTGSSSPSVAQVNHQGSSQETRITPGPVSDCTFTAVKQGSNCVISVTRTGGGPMTNGFPKVSYRRFSETVSSWPNTQLSSWDGTNGSVSIDCSTNPTESRTIVVDGFGLGNAAVSSGTAGGFRCRPIVSPGSGATTVMDGGSNQLNLP